MRILVAEDDARLAELLERGLGEEGHAVDLAANGHEALDWIAVAPASAYDAVVLDVMLPDISGLEVCRTLRRRRLGTPILLLTARDAVHDRVAGLDAGADDYLVKPFAFAELTARLRALSRRPAVAHDPLLSVAGVRLDPATRKVWRGESEIELGTKQFRILEYLMRHPNRVLTRAMIAEHVWDDDFPNATNVIDVHIGVIRRKLAEAAPDDVIQTVRGAGYRIVAER